MSKRGHKTPKMLEHKGSDIYIQTYAQLRIIPIPSAVWTLVHTCRGVMIDLLMLK